MTEAEMRYVNRKLMEVGKEVLSLSCFIRFKNGQTMSEIATELDIPESAVRSEIAKINAGVKVTAE